MKKFISGVTAILVCLFFFQTITLASSHREAPLIAFDPLADNTDLYAFRSPSDASKIMLIANYIPFEHPAGGPNWYTFGENIRYEIHVDNNTATPGDDIIYRFTFKQVNEDPTTFFLICLGKENLKTTYTLERSMDGGRSFTAIIMNGVVPPPNIGPRSIENSVVGLGSTDPQVNNNYKAIMTRAITTASTGEKVFAGPIDDPFFADLGGIFDLGNFRKEGQARDALAKFNCHSLVLEVPISTLQKNGKSELQTTSILDPEFVIGVWASASRRGVTTLDAAGGKPMSSGGWVQVSRLGMPLTNEVIIPLGVKDYWNTVIPGTGNEGVFKNYFNNPELALYMDDSKFGTAVPGLADLRIQSNSLGAFDFRNGKSGLFSLKGTPAVAGTALDEAAFGSLLLPDNSSPRSVDLMPLFFFGVPNLAPYQLATGKNGNPLAAGKPFINNFLPNNADMLRLNMAVPATSRTDPDFSSLGLIKAAVLGLTDPRFNGSTALQAIPNMDGFPNGRRLEDDVTTIELQAVGGVVLAAIGLWYDDFDGNGSPVTPQLVRTISFNAGVTSNDTTFQESFPFVQTPWRGFNGESFVGPKSCVTPVFLNTPPIIGNANCGQNDGQIVFIPTGGTGPFFYSIDGGANYTAGPDEGFTFFNVAPGMYQLKIRGANGCESETITREVLSVNCNDNNRVMVTAYPNPSTGKFRIQVQHTDGAKAEVFVVDSKGTLVEKMVLNLSKNSASDVNLSGKAPGMYYIRVVSAKGVSTTSVMIQ